MGLAITIAVFGRIGARAFNLEEMKPLYMGRNRHPFTVTDRVETEDFVPAGVQQHK